VHILGAVLAVVVIAPVGAVCVALIVANTKALNEHKLLGAELADIQRDFDALGPDATYEEVAAINQRLDAYAQRWCQFRASPLVITRD
jgi:outer membrane murein-binding lipoprotein Lpp